MNHLSIVNKHLKGLEAAYGAIKSPVTLAKAKCGIVESLDRVWPSWVDVVAEMKNPSPNPVEFKGGGAVVATVTVGRENNVPASVSEASAGVSVAREVVLTPVSDHEVEEPAVEGDVNNTSGTFYPETVTSEIGGWPEYARIEVLGMFPNRRSLKGALGDGRTVHVERRMDWKPGEIRGRLVRAGAAPLYRNVSL